MQQIFGAGMFTHSSELNIIFNHFLCLPFRNLRDSLSTSDEGACDLQCYADLFKQNHITGKRLLLLTENDMRDMGVKSKGHAMHLKASLGLLFMKLT